ncbi:hypothetical protein T484DRAFT_1814956, partial [Baffinella frigidus]
MPSLARKQEKKKKKKKKEEAQEGALLLLLLLLVRVLIEMDSLCKAEEAAVEKSTIHFVSKQAVQTKLDKAEDVMALRRKIEHLLANSSNPTYEKDKKGVQASNVTPEGKSAGMALLQLCKPILNFPSDILHRKVSAMRHSSVIPAITCCVGGENVIAALDFYFSGGCWVLPPDADLEKMRVVTLFVCQKLALHHSFLQIAVVEKVTEAERRGEVIKRDLTLIMQQT